MDGDRTTWLFFANNNKFFVKSTFSLQLFIAISKFNRSVHDFWIYSVCAILSEPQADFCLLTLTVYLTLTIKFIPDKK